MDQANSRHCRGFLRCCAPKGAVTRSTVSTRRSLLHDNCVQDQDRHNRSNHWITSRQRDLPIVSEALAGADDVLEKLATIYHHDTDKELNCHRMISENIYNLASALLAQQEGELSAVIRSK